MKRITSRGKRDNAITLIALIVTVIILMILTGVVIATIIGNNGVLNKTKFARDEYKMRTNEENQTLSIYENEIDKASIGIASSRENEQNSSNIITGVTFETSSISDNSVNLKIIPTATSKDYILGYHVIAINENNNSDVVAIMTTDEETQLTGLNENSNYNIYVAAYDKYNNVRISAIQKIKTFHAFDFMKKINKDIFTTTENEYFRLSGVNTQYLVNSQTHWGNTLPILTVVDTNSYGNFYTSNKLEHDFKKIILHIRTRNDGTNYATLKWGIVSNIGDSPTWVEKANDSVTCGNSPSWKDYEAEINIPNGVNAKDNYLQFYFQHYGSAFSMAIEFISLKGIY